MNGKRSQVMRRWVLQEFGGEVPVTLQVGGGHRSLEEVRAEMNPGGWRDSE